MTVNLTSENIPGPHRLESASIHHFLFRTTSLDVSWCERLHIHPICLIVSKMLGLELAEQRTDRTQCCFLQICYQNFDS
jgi:hypothetical protein